jgi:hypothetical protein
VRLCPSTFRTNSWLINSLCYLGKSKQAFSDGLAQRLSLLNTARVDKFGGTEHPGPIPNGLSWSPAHSISDADTTLAAYLWWERLTDQFWGPRDAFQRLLGQVSKSLTKAPSLSPSSKCGAQSLYK